ncbi:hypothetical protein DYB25_005404 [Aphanomyces astaci]|uniref:Tc1-like transposase DDE domain-containing protein n=1 Tax=Aphanomyces astaci TaxID=112090 RepID=A0A397BAI5_APHAT|nr:hypothetical protein DYB25_005404 [Aphanomyces astaci]
MVNQAPRTCKDVSSSKKAEVIQQLHHFLVNGKLVRGAFTRTAEMLDIERRSVAYIWDTFCTRGTLTSNKCAKVGPKPKYSPDDIRNLVIPAIKASFPSANKRVVLQHDNATPHASITDAELEAVSTDGWKIVLRRQPPNSPDLNALDLGFFASIQSLQYKSMSRTVDDVIRSTLAAFEELSYEKLESVFLTFQSVMRLILEHDGGNHYVLPHLKKAALRRAGLLMQNVSCPVSLLL